jgi:Zn ribbon nucleic-acid-binding protein
MSIALRLPPTCTHCNTVQILPEWSENAGENETVCFWRCLVCGHEFKTIEQLLDRKPSKDELAEEFLPNLVVE